MSIRKALDENTILEFENGFKCRIQNEIGRGHSCIVYNANYVNNVGEEKIIRIKEMYPCNIRINRNFDNSLIVNEEDKEKFNSISSNFVNSFKSNNRMFNILKNSVANLINIYSLNNTKYIVYAYSHGEILEYKKERDLKTVLEIVNNLCKNIKKIHENGCLYLDIKPSNIFVLDDMNNNIQLFDFDSLFKLEKGINEYTITTTREFAPYELISCDFKNIGFYSDIYEIGCLLFYLIFGKLPDPLECEKCNRNYENTILDVNNIDDKAIGLLNDIFNKTLCVLYEERYQNINELENIINEVLELSDEKSHYLNSTIIRKNKCFVGRDKEIESLKNWSTEQNDNVIFVYGLPGIGKFSLVNEFLYREQKNFDKVVYLKFNNSIEECVCDDVNLRVNGICHLEEEKLDEYFKRKLSVIKEIVKDKKYIFVVNNFSGDINSRIIEFINMDAKFIFISNEIINTNSYEKIEVVGIEDNDYVYKLFSNYLEREITDDETQIACKLAESLNYHTEALCCIARQMLVSDLNIKDIYDKFVNKGYFSLSNEMIHLDDNYETKKATIKEIFTQLLNIDSLSIEKKKILFMLYLFNGSCINKELLKNFIGLDNYDIINELINNYYIRRTNELVDLEPLIIETVKDLDLNDEIVEYVNNITEKLYIKLHIEGSKEEYPKPYFERLIKTKKLFDKKPEIANRLLSKYKKGNTIEKIYYERVMNTNYDNSYDRELVSTLLHYSSNYIQNGKQIDWIKNDDNFICLLYETTMNQPIRNKDLVLNGLNDLMKFESSKNEYLLARLFDKAIDMHLTNKEYKDAYKMTEITHEYAISSKDNLVMAMYYDSLCNYYETILSDEENNTSYDEGQKIFNKYFDSMKKSIYYANRKSKFGKERSKMLLVKLLAGYCNTLVRNDFFDESIFYKNIKKAERISNKYCQEYSLGFYGINMAYAYYYAIQKNDLDIASTYFTKAARIFNKINRSRLQVITDILIPLATILRENNEIEEAKKYLIKGIEICDEEKNIIPYQKMKERLETYINDLT